MILLLESGLAVGELLEYLAARSGEVGLKRSNLVLKFCPVGEICGSPLTKLQWRPEARLARLCYLGRVLVRVSRDGQAKPPDPQRTPVCNCGTDGFVCRLRSKVFLAHLKPCGIGNPRRHPYPGRDRQRIPRLNREIPKPVQRPTWRRTGGDRR